MMGTFNKHRMSFDHEWFLAQGIENHKHEQPNKSEQGTDLNQSYAPKTAYRTRHNHDEYIQPMTKDDY